MFLILVFIFTPYKLQNYANWPKREFWSSHFHCSICSGKSHDLVCIWMSFLSSKTSPPASLWDLLSITKICWWVCEEAESHNNQSVTNFTDFIQPAHHHWRTNLSVLCPKLQTKPIENPVLRPAEFSRQRKYKSNLSVDRAFMSSFPGQLPTRCPLPLAWDHGCSCGAEGALVQRQAVHVHRHAQNASEWQNMQTWWWVLCIDEFISENNKSGRSQLFPSWNLNSTQNNICVSHADACRRSFWQDEKQLWLQNMANTTQDRCKQIESSQQCYIRIIGYNLFCDIITEWSRTGSSAFYVCSRSVRHAKRQRSLKHTAKSVGNLSCILSTEYFAKARFKAQMFSAYMFERNWSKSSRKCTPQVFCSEMRLSCLPITLWLSLWNPMKR